MEATGRPEPLGSELARGIGPSCRSRSEPMVMEPKPLRQRGSHPPIGHAESCRHPLTFSKPITISFPAPPQISFLTMLIINMLP